MAKRAGDFLGTWRIDRSIEDRAGGQAGRLVGTATFTGVADGMTYEEQGMLSLGGNPPVAASRRYLWRELDDVIDIYFDHGGFFHRLLLGGDPVDAEHHCGDDLYRGSYDFDCWPEWTAAWEVRGARKDYRMVTTYRRDPEGMKR